MWHNCKLQMEVETWNLKPETWNLKPETIIAAQQTQLQP